MKKKFITSPVEAFHFIQPISGSDCIICVQSKDVFIFLIKLRFVQFVCTGDGMDRENWWVLVNTAKNLQVS
jgi:hypothetical protein